jgi:hypothetical protein
MKYLIRGLLPQARPLCCTVSPRQTAVDRDLLPMELWELVFERLSEDDLLIAARVCCTRISDVFA